MTDFKQYILEDDEGTAWKKFARDGRKVEAIKAFRAMHGAGLKEAKDIVEEYDDRFKRAGLNHARMTVTSDTIALPDGGTLTVVSNGLRTSIIYNKVEDVNLLASEVPQAIADAVMKYTLPRYYPATATA